MARPKKEDSVEVNDDAVLEISEIRFDKQLQRSTTSSVKAPVTYMNLIPEGKENDSMYKGQTWAKSITYYVKYNIVMIQTGKEEYGVPISNIVQFTLKK